MADEKLSQLPVVPSTSNGDLYYVVQGGISSAITFTNLKSSLGVGSGTVTNVSFTSANGFTGSVSNSTTTPAISIGTSVTGILYGNGSSIAAAISSNFPVLNQNTTGTSSNVTAISNSTLITLSSLSLPYSQLSGTVPTWNQNTTGTAANITATTNSTLVTLSALSLPYSQITGAPTSLVFSDSLIDTLGTVTLVNDGTPTASQYYGTNVSSTLGYHNLPTPTVSFPLLAPEAASPTISYGFLETSNDTGWGSDGDGAMFWATNGIEAMRLTYPGDLHLAGNFTAANFPPIGSVNSFTGYDSSGNLISIPGWAWDNISHGVNMSSSYDLSISTITTNNFDVDASPTADNANSFLGYNLNTRYDNLGLNFSSHEADGLNVYLAHNVGTGTLDFMRGMSVDVHAGDTGNAGTVTQLNTADFASTIGSGFTVTDGNGLSLQLNQNGIFNEDYISLRINSNGNEIGHNYTGMDLNVSNDVANDKNMINVFSSGAIGNNFRVLDSGNSSNIAQNYFGFNLGNTGNAGQGIFGYEFFNSGIATLDFNGVNIGNTGSAGGNSIGFSYVDSGNSGGFIGASIFKSGNTTDVSRYAKGIQVDLNGNSAQDIIGQSLSIAGTAAGTVNGLQINVTNAHSGNGFITAIDSQGGAANFTYEVDTAIVTPSPFGNIHGLQGQLTVSSGFPILATPLFLTNFGWNIGFSDDVTADNSVGAGDSLGTSMIAAVNEIAGATGKTLDTLNFALLGGSNSDAGTGTITNLNIYRGVGIINAGGGLSVTNSKIFYVDPVYDGALGTNKWGFINASSTSDNWFKKNVIVGGTSGLPTGAYALDVIGDAKIDGSLTLTIPLSETNGGTNTNTYATGDILYASASNTLSKLPIGTVGEVLTVSAGVPSWQSPGGGGLINFPMVDNQAAPAAVLSVPVSDNAILITYSVKRSDGTNTQVELGKLILVTDGLSATLTPNIDAQTMNLGITFSAQVIGGNVELDYTSTNTGFAPTMNYNKVSY